MVQIEPVIWLQSLESPALTWLMSAVTNLGYTPVYATVLVILIFGVRVKLGLFVFTGMLIGGVLVDGMKRGMEFPRPSDVDARVIEPGYERPPLLVDGGGAKSFWALPSAEAMEATRIQTDWSYGFPSGHVAAATAFLLGLAFFFRSKKVLAFAILWILLMALSRMYLGRHFIADVIGGMGVGVFAVGIAAYLTRPLRTEASKMKMESLLRWTAFVIALVVLAPFIEILDKENIGRLLGILATYALLLYTGMPSDQGKLWQRVARVLLAFLVFVIIDRILNPFIESTGLEETSFAMLVATSLIMFASLAGTILIARRLKLYESIEQT